jgi:LysM repeat protein
VWLGRAVGSGNWAESLIEFVDFAKASGNPNALVNLSLDLTQVDADGSITTRYEFTPREREALEYARQNHVLAVVAAGNDGDVMSVLGQASQEFDNIITAGAANGVNRADYSSFGYGLDIVAEGGSIAEPVLSTVGDDVGTIAGTSVATAQVTGAASLLWEANPGLNYRQVIEALTSSATDLNVAGWDSETGAGLLNADAAVETARAMVPVVYTPAAFLTPTTWDGEGLVTPEERAASDEFNGQYYDWVPYTIVSGDSLSQIALDTMGDSSEAAYNFIAQHNGIADPNLIYAGQVIEIPTEGVAQTASSNYTPTGGTTGSTDGWELYTVQEGDSLSAIAQARTGSASDYQLIVNYPQNDIPNPDLIYPGQQIWVPKAGTASSPGSTILSVAQQYGLGSATSGLINYSGSVSYQLFEKGSVVSSQYGTFPLYGGIRQTYLSAGGLNGALGAPTSAEMGLGNGVIKQTFENGYIIWNGSTATAYYNGQGTPITDSPVNISSANNGGSLPTSTQEANAFFKLQYWNSTYNPDGPNFSSNCGPASLAMVIETLGLEPSGISTETSIDHARYLMFGYSNGTSQGVLILDNDSAYTNFEDVKNGIINSGGTPEQLTGWNNLDQCLGAGKPVISYGYYGSAWRNQFPSWAMTGTGETSHWNAILGKTAGGKYIVADPMYRGGTVEMSREQLSVYTYNGYPNFIAFARN